MNRHTPAVLAAAFALAAVAVAATFGTDALAPFSGFAAGVLKAVICVVAFVGLDRWVLPGDVHEEVVAKRNVAYGLMLVALAVLLSATIATAQPAPTLGATPGASARRADEGGILRDRGAVVGRAARQGLPAGVLRDVQHSADGERPPWVTTGLRYVGTREASGRNDGPTVARFLRSVGVTTPAPWCAAFVRTALDEGRGEVVRADGTSIRSGVATAWLQGRGTIPARLVERGLVRPPRGSLGVYRNGRGWTGHLVIVDWWDRRCGETVEGNTSSGRSGSQRDGDGVWARTRCVSPGAYFRIVGFVPVVAGAGAPAGAAPRILAPAARRRGLFAPLRWRLRPGTWAT